jgi:hypothetical protein
MKTLLIAVAASLIFACTKPTVEVLETPQTARLTGTYTLISDPFRCSLPSTSEVSIAAQGSTFDVSYTNIYTKKVTIITGITAEKTTEGFVLKLDGKDFGKYINDSYIGNNGKEQAMILFLQSQLSQTEYLEFMGKK